MNVIFHLIEVLFGSYQFLVDNKSKKSSNSETIDEMSMFGFALHFVLML